MCYKLAPDEATQHMRQHNTHTKVKAFHWMSHSVLVVLLCQGMECEALPMQLHIAYRKALHLHIAYRISHIAYRILNSQSSIVNRQESIVNSQSYCFSVRVPPKAHRSCSPGHFPKFSPVCSSSITENASRDGDYRLGAWTYVKTCPKVGHLSTCVKTC
jgi:hypothetical protein